MNRKLVIIGAGGHGRVIADIASKCGIYENTIFLDDADGMTSPISGKVKDFVKYIDTSDFVVAVGDNEIREKIHCELEKHNAIIATLVHPNAVVGKNVRIGSGTTVMAGAVINPGAIIGRGVIVNTCSSIDHDCVIEDFCHISVGAHLAGTVNVGKAVFIGAGVVVINNIKICSGCTIGAGAVVVKDILQKCLAVGCPARFLKDKN